MSLSRCGYICITSLRRSMSGFGSNLQGVDPRDKLYSTSQSTLDDLPIIHIKATFNNTIFSITDSKGRVLAWTSAGAEGFCNARRGTTFAAQSAAMAAAKKSLGLGFKQVRVKLKGIGPGRQASLKGLEFGGVSVAVLQDVTPVPHNGCKPRKTRRL